MAAAKIHALDYADEATIEQPHAKEHGKHDGSEYHIKYKKQANDDIGNGGEYHPAVAHKATIRRKTLHKAHDTTQQHRNTEPYGYGEVAREWVNEHNEARSECHKANDNREPPTSYQLLRVVTIITIHTI